jgi:hypothetical protein
MIETVYFRVFGHWTMGRVALGYARQGVPKTAGRISSGKGGYEPSRQPNRRQNRISKGDARTDGSRCLILLPAPIPVNLRGGGTMVKNWSIVSMQEGIAWRIIGF